MARFWTRLWRLDSALSEACRRVRLDLNYEYVCLTNALDRVVVEDIVAPYNIPLYNTSVVDGYAVKSSDTLSASPSNPIRLRVRGVIETGEPPDKYGVLGHGWAVEVFTGSPLPIGADAVVMYEDVVVGREFIDVLKPVPRWANVTRCGDDIRAGEFVVKKYTLLNPFHIVALANLGVDRVRVFEKIRVGVLSIGSELVGVGGELVSGKRYASTEYLVLGILDKMGFVETRYYGIVEDDLGKLSSVLDKALSENHVVVTVGGTSVSRRDIVPDYVEEYGEWVVRGIALRPGRTTSLAIVRDKPLFTLSGHVVAAWVGLEAFLKPLIYKWVGLGPPKPLCIKAVLKHRIVNPVGYRSFVRVYLREEDGVVYVEPYMVHGSSILSSLLKTHGYIVVPEDLEGYEAGEEVCVHTYNFP